MTSPDFKKQAALQLLREMETSKDLGFDVDDLRKTAGVVSGLIGAAGGGLGYMAGNAMTGGAPVNAVEPLLAAAGSGWAGYRHGLGGALTGTVASTGVGALRGTINAAGGPAQAIGLNPRATKLVPSGEAAKAVASGGDAAKSVASGGTQAVAEGAKASVPEAVAAGKPQTVPAWVPAKGKWQDVALNDAPAATSAAAAPADKAVSSLSGAAAKTQMSRVPTVGARMARILNGPAGEAAGLAAVAGTPMAVSEALDRHSYPELYKRHKRQTA